MDGSQIIGSNKGAITPIPALEKNLDSSASNIFDESGFDAESSPDKKSPKKSGANTKRLRLEQETANIEQKKEKMMKQSCKEYQYVIDGKLSAYKKKGKKKKRRRPKKIMTQKSRRSFLPNTNQSRRLSTKQSLK